MPQPEPTELARLEGKVDKILKAFETMVDVQGPDVDMDIPAFLRHGANISEHHNTTPHTDRLVKTVAVDDGRDPWKHRSAGMVCRTCMWFVPKAVPEDGMAHVVLGRCRRHAPAMMGYPPVYQTDWCGDHKMNENKV